MSIRTPIRLCQIIDFAILCANAVPNHAITVGTLACARAAPDDAGTTIAVSGLALADFASKVADFVSKIADFAPVIADMEAAPALSRRGQGRLSTKNEGSEVKCSVGAADNHYRPSDLGLKPASLRCLKRSVRTSSTRSWNGM
jgi:hypothetical protein